MTPPFEAPPQIIATSDRPIGSFGWTNAGTPYFTSGSDRGTRVEVFAVKEGQAREVWSGATEDVYGDPGSALRVDGDRGPVVEIDDHSSSPATGSARPVRSRSWTR